MSVSFVGGNRVVCVVFERCDCATKREGAEEVKRKKVGMRSWL